eukprot:Gb_09020 [translate_table: standard]
MGGRDDTYENRRDDSQSDSRSPPYEDQYGYDNRPLRKEVQRVKVSMPRVSLFNFQRRFEWRNFFPTPADGFLLEEFAVRGIPQHSMSVGHSFHVGERKQVGVHVSGNSIRDISSRRMLERWHFCRRGPSWGRLSERCRGSRRRNVVVRVGETPSEMLVVNELSLHAKLTAY